MLRTQVLAATPNVAHRPSFGTYLVARIMMFGSMLRMDQKAFTVRLDSDQASELEALAGADGISVAEAIREAVSDLIEARRKDPGFQARIRSIIEQNQRVLERLAE